MIPKLIRNYTAAALVPGNVFVRPVAGNTIGPAAAAADPIFGVSTQVPAVPGEPVDVIHVGIGEVVVGAGGCNPGDLLTSDAAGNAVVAAAGNRIGGVALALGAQGDIIPVLLTCGVA